MPKYRWIRLYSGLIMLISLLIPWIVRADYVSPPTGFFMLRGSLEFIDWLGPDKLARHPEWAIETLIFMFPFWIIPILALSNLYLWRRSKKTVLLIYRVLFGWALLITVYRAGVEGMHVVGIGYWANTLIIIVSAGVELVILLKGYWRRLR